MLLSATIFSLCACQKEDADSTFAQTDTPVTESVCTHANIYHVPCVEPDGSTFGWAEHWFCLDCGGCFADAKGSEEMDEIILWGSNLNTSDATGIEKMCEIYDGFVELSASLAVANEESAIGKFILEQLKNGIMSGVGSVFKSILSVFHKWGEDPPKPSTTDILKGILDELRNIERAINDLTNTLKQLDEKNMMVDREKRSFYLFNATHPAFMAMLKELDDVTTESDLTDVKKSNIKAIVNEWYKKGIYNGSVQEDCYISVCDLMHFFNGYVASKSFVTMYDEMAEQQVPWIHEQEPIKYLIRIADVMTLTEGYMMVALYLYFNTTDTSDEMLRQLSSEFTSYFKAIENHPVPHDKKGYHEWTWADRDGKSRLDEWYLYDTLWKYDGMEAAYDEMYCNENYLWKDSHTIMTLWNAGHKAHDEITVDENRVISEYYRTKYGIKVYYDALVKAGFKGVVPYDKKGRLVCWDGSGFDYRSDESGQYRNLGWVRHMGYIQFYNVVKSDGFYIQREMWKDDNVWRCYVDWNYKYSGNLRYIINKGESCGLVFEAVTRNPDLKSRKTGQ